MKKKILTVFCLVIGSFCFYVWTVDASELGLEIYFVRHAETVANVTKDYSGNNGETLTTEGVRQTFKIAKKLEKYEFDVILVSPKKRTRQTILPYLKEHQLQSQITPEIAECCWQDEEEEPDPCSKKVYGKEIKIIPENNAFFKFRNKDANRFYLKKTYAQGLYQLEDAYNLLKEKYWLSGKKILLVSHGVFGRMLISRLLGHDYGKNYGLENAKITHLRQSKNGDFHLMKLNGRDPVE